jgi:hypothetical protein
MKLQAVLVKLTLVAGIGYLGLVLATTAPLDHRIFFLLLIAGFVLCDRSFWRGSSS